MSSLFFPGQALREIDYNIISFLDDDLKSLINLSAVCKLSNDDLLSNGSYFQALFKNRCLTELYYYSEKFPKFYSLELKFPDCCWKIANAVFRNSQRSCRWPHCDFRLKREIPDFDFVELIPYVEQHLNEQKNRLQYELFQICGRFYADPQSLIHQAWELHQVAQKLLLRKSVLAIPLREIASKISELKTALIKNGSGHSESEVDTLFSFFSVCPNALALIMDKFEQFKRNEFVVIVDERFRGSTFNGFMKFRRNLIPEYKKIPELLSQEAQILEQTNAIEKQLELNSSNQERTLLDRNKELSSRIIHLLSCNSLYSILEISRLSIEKDIKNIEIDIESIFNFRNKWNELDEKRKNEIHEKYRKNFKYVIPENPFLTCRRIALEKFEQERGMEITFTYLGYFSKILKYVLKESTPSTSQEENLQRIREAIKPFFSIDHMLGSCGLSQFIWETLYHRCANQVIEENWATKHFHEHLPELLQIVDETIARIKSCSPYFGVDLSKDQAKS